MSDGPLSPSMAKKVQSFKVSTLPHLPEDSEGEEEEETEKKGDK